MLNISYSNKDQKQNHLNSTSCLFFCFFSFLGCHFLQSHSLDKVHSFVHRKNAKKIAITGLWNWTTSIKPKENYSLILVFFHTVAQLVIHSFVTPLELFWVAPSSVVCIQLWNDSVHHSHPHPHNHKKRHNLCRWKRFSLSSF